VTNLDDSGSGSLREALTAKGPRTVLFKVAGTITLNDEINIKEPFLTVAGQTAPGQGVQIRGGSIKITTHDVAMRYLKVRSGDAINNNLTQERDSVTLNGEINVYNIVIDHCTMIWGPDIGGIALLQGALDATISYSIIGEGLYISNHPEATSLETGHSTAMNITELSSSLSPERITIHHNLLTTSSDRNPRVIGGTFIDFVNNVVYNWRDGASAGNPRMLNLINNYFIMGPMNTNPRALLAWKPEVESGGVLHTGSVHESGNQLEGFQTVRGGPLDVYAPGPLGPGSLNNQDSALDAYNKIVDDAGANRQVAGPEGNFVTLRDSVDQRIMNNLINRTGTFMNGVDFNGVDGFPAISWPELAAGTPATDNDNDGMPDSWEARYFGGTGRGSPDNSSSDYDSDGYTDLEEYLNGTDPTQRS
jgi:pectate lyase